MNFKLLAYAQSFVSFLIGNLDRKTASSIEKIVLFGSVTRGESNKSSDIDIFIDVTDNEKTLEKNVRMLVRDFYKSIHAKYWNLMGIDLEIKPVIGKLKNWDSLRTSIIANGIILYGKYSEQFEGKNYVIIAWKKVESESKRVLLSKKIYGYNYQEKHYSGVIEKFGGKKLSSNCVMIGIEHAEQLLEIFKDLKLTFKQLYVNALE